MALSQGAMNRVAQKIRSAHGSLSQQVTVLHRTSAQGTVTTFGPLLIPRMQQPSEESVAMAALAGERPLVLGSDRSICLLTADVTWQPTTYDEVIDAAGNTWRVLGLADGPGHPFWRLQCRLVRQEHS